MERVEAEFDRIVRAIVNEGPVRPEDLKWLVRLTATDIDRVIRGLWASFEERVLPSAMASMALGKEQDLSVSFNQLQELLAREKLSRAEFDELAKKMFTKSLKKLETAIRSKEVGSIAPVIFYSPEIKDGLRQFIETVQQGFEAAGDVTAQKYRITLVSTNKAELLEFISELSKAGVSRGVQHFAVDGSEQSWAQLAKQVTPSVIRHPVFGERFGIFFPDEAFANQVPEWQRVVHSEIPREYAMLLLPDLARYFGTVTTSEINATTLRHALPDLFASAAFRVGRGIAVVAAFLAQIAAADRQIASAA